MPKISLYLFLILIGSTNTKFKGQNNKIDSLLTILKTVKEDTNKVKTLNILSKKLWEAGNYHNALQYAKQAKTLAEKISSSPEPGIARAGKQGLANSMNNMGIAYDYEGDYTKALQFYLYSLKIQEEIGDKEGLASSFGNIGIVYDYQGDYPRALEYYFKALKIQEEIEDKRGIAASLTNIGLIYFYQGDFQKALQQYFYSLKIYEETGNKYGIAVSFMNIGNIYNLQNNFQKALEQYLKSLKIREEIGDKDGVGATLSNIGSLYKKQGDYPNALEKYFKSLKIYAEIRNKNGLASSYMNLGSITTRFAGLSKSSSVHKREKFKEALKYLNDALSISKETGYKDVIRDSYNGLTELYGFMSNYKRSLEYYKMFVIYRDSLFNEENTKKTVQSQMNYEFDKKEQAAKLDQERKDAVANEEKQKQKIIRNSFIGGFAFVLLLASLILRGFRNKQKANVIISKQKEEVELAKKIIEEQKQEVELKQKEILDSIYYAKRIQMALITSESYIHKRLNSLIK